MLNLKEARKIVLENVKLSEKVKVPLFSSYGRFLSENIRAKNDIPSFSRSLMDGYAVREIDIKKLPCILKIKRIISAGKVFKGEIKRGECVKIMTGAKVPEICDRVIKIEDTVDLRNGYVKILKKDRDRFINYKGEMIKKGEIILRKGSFIREFEMSVLASFGIKYVPVYNLPEVALIVTGDEIIDYRKELKDGKVREINSVLLRGLFKKIGIVPKFFGIVKDSEKKLMRVLNEAIRNYDILVVSGGVSMGDFDLVPKVLKKSGVKIIFHKVKVKPGKPFLFGKKGNKIIFGVPGNSVSGIVSFINFIKPAILKMTGKEGNYFPEVYRGELKRELNFISDRFTFLPCKVEIDNKKFVVEPAKYVCSADVVSLTKANAFMLLKEGNYKLKKGVEVKFIFL